MIRQRAATVAFIVMMLGASRLRAQPDDSLVAVSADIVEISGSMSKDMGFTWGPFQTGITFFEKTIPGIYTVGDFARQTALQTQLRMLESEGKAQILSNPKVIVQAGTEADFNVGSEIPFPVVNNQGVGTEPQKAFTTLSILPVINPNKKDTIRAEIMVEVSNFDFSQTFQVGQALLPSKNTRQMKTAVEVKSGETLVLGGFKSSSKTIAKGRVPFLGRIPLLGLLFTTTSVQEKQQSLFLFITMEIVK